MADTGAPNLPVIDQAKLMSLMNAPCDANRPVQIAQTMADPSPTPTATPSPSASASGAPAPPRAPTGPIQLIPPPLASPSPSFTPVPIPTPTPTASPNTGPVYVVPIAAGASPSPSPGATASASASPTPTPAETLAPNTYVVLSDDIKGAMDSGAPADLDGNVNIFYSEGIVVGEHAHYDGVRFIDVTGHPYIRNRADDSIIHADAIRFDSQLHRSILVNGQGSTTQGVETGHFYFKAKTLTTTSDGHTHGDRASFTTCERQRAGYHVEAKTLDITPGEKAVARSAVLFLGGFAIFYLPIVIIPLTHDENAQRRATGFVPLFGYSQTEGFFVKSKIGFSPSDYYYGYYRVDMSTKLGLGLGYIAFFRRKDGKRAVDVNFYNARQTQGATPTSNLTLNDTENFSQALRGQFGVNYQSNYAPGVVLPATLNLTGSLVHTGARESQNYTFAENSTGSTQSSMNAAFTDTRHISPAITQTSSLSYTSNSSSFGSFDSTVTSLHLDSLTHVGTRGVDYDLTFDKTDSATPFGISKLPELQIRPHSALDPNFKLLPITTQLTIGDYSESRADPLPGDAPVLTTQRADLLVTFGPAIAHFLDSDFNATVTAHQYAYGTGDLKGQVTQQASLTTPLFKHFVNAITYSENNSNGPQAEPFQTFDTIGGASHQASDTLRIFNGDVYTLSISSSTFFTGTAQPYVYQLNMHPSPRSSLILGGSYQPGPGAFPGAGLGGFSTTNAQIITPFGRGSDIQFATNIDWKSHGRLEDKNIFYRRIIGDCYELLIGYNQDLKQVTATVEILAFPSHTASFGLANSTSILPGNLGFQSGP
jgi:hypothetical protein